MSTNWSTLEASKVVSTLKTDPAVGLSNAEVQKRLQEYGPNAFEEGKKKTFLMRLWGQFKSPLVLILFVAGLATLFLHEYFDAGVIFLALGVNIAIGLMQEERASRAFEKLMESQEDEATVIRDGAKHIVPADSIVPGDIVKLMAGAAVPADMYLLKGQKLSADESMLTGESVPEKKKVDVLDKEEAITEQHNMLWMGTFISTGLGDAVVVATGGDTQIGAIAEGLLDAEEVLTPIQKNMRKLARFLSVIIAIVVALIFAFGLIRGEGLGEMLLLAIAVAVSVIPEGLPAAVTAILAIGMERILKEGGLVRNLLAAETLGSTTTILTDKTGTLTRARMKLTNILTLGDNGEDQKATVHAAVQVADAFMEGEKIHGDPIEAAILEYSLAQGISKEGERDDFLPFDSANRFAAALFDDVVYISGAPEYLLERATHILKGGKRVAITEADKEEVLRRLQEEAEKGTRLIATATKPAKADELSEPGDIVRDITFYGLLGFLDPIRKRVPKAIATAQSAGARVIMLTGDNPKTAQTIATQAGIDGAEHVLSGKDLEGMDDDELRERIKTTSVFARVLPQQKLRIAKLLQGEGEVVAMTGDGINDAPALQRADIGIAVGSGTEVAKEAADLVLLNDSFAIIVSAIREGRRIIDNLKKAVTHLLATSFGEVFVIAGAIAFGLELPILAIQILWLNIVEEGLLTFAFAFEPAEDDVMRRDPRSDSVQNVFTKKVRNLIIAAGSATGILIFILYVLLVNSPLSIEEIRTIIFAALSLDAIFFAISLKNLHQPVWRIHLWSNKYLSLALGISIVLLFGAMLIPGLQTILSLVPLSATGIEILAAIAVIDVLIIEIAKKVLFKRS